MPIACFAGSAREAGTRAAVFLRDGQGARAIGMGGAYAAAGRGVSSIFWNPGGLGRGARAGVMASYNSLVEDIHSQSLAAAVPSERLGGTVALGAVQMDGGEIDRRDPTGRRLGNARAVGRAYSVGYGFNKDRLGLGAVLKSVQETLGPHHGGAWAADLGAQVDMDGVDLGVSVANLGSDYRIGSAENSLPSVVRLGLSWDRWVSGRMTAAADVEKPVDGDLTFRLGAEYRLGPGFALRAGTSRPEEGPSGVSLGMGLARGFGAGPQGMAPAAMLATLAAAFELDYAYLLQDSTEGFHRLTVTFQFP